MGWGIWVHDIRNPLTIKQGLNNATASTMGILPT